MVRLNQKQYAEKLGISQASVSFRINNNMSLPGVKRMEKVNRFYFLHFDDGISDDQLEQLKKEFRNINK